MTREICVQIKNKVHHVNQFIEADLMMYTHMTFSKKTTPLHSTHSNELFKIFFSLLTLSTAFLQKARGTGKNFFAQYLMIKLLYRFENSTVVKKWVKMLWYNFCEDQ